MPSPVRSFGRYAPVAVLAVTLVVFGGVVAFLSFRLRDGLRSQILGREAEALTEVASLQLANEAAALGPDFQNVPGQLLTAVLKTSRLRGVFAVRVFDAAQHFSGALPIAWSEDPPPANEWSKLAGGTPIVRLHARERAAEVIGLTPGIDGGNGGEPLLETWLPLRQSEHAPLAGVAQMWINGEAVAREFAAVDRRVLTQGLLAWIAGSLIISVVLLWAFRRLEAANHELAARSDDLLRANRELTLAAKTSALGAVAGHLMHELKNPVAGLEEFVAAQAEMATPGTSGGELAAASELTRRLRTMINDIVAVMRDEQTGAHFDLTNSEVMELVDAKVRASASAKGVAVERIAESSGALHGRKANLVVLVLSNLVQNAIEASASGTRVTICSRVDGGRIVFSVRDEGPGLPETVVRRLFQPCTSSKRGGSGLGLALSQQLARQAGGRIELLNTAPSGTCFQLVLEPEL